jgi:hypothetical protein
MVQDLPLQSVCWADIPQLPSPGMHLVHRLGNGHDAQALILDRLFRPGITPSRRVPA